MARQTLRYYYELLLRASKNIETSEAMLDAVQAENLYDLAFRRTVVVKQFELAYEMLIKPMFKAANELPEPEPREDRVSWTEAYRMWHDLGITSLSDRTYMNFKKVRNLTVHTYNVDVYLEEVLPILPAFKAELADVLLRILPLLPNEE